MDAHCRACADEIGHGDFDVLFANSCRFYRTTSIGRFSPIPSVLYLQEPYRWLYEAMPDNRWAALPPSPALSLRTAKRTFADLRDNRNARVQVREEIINAKAFNLILCNSLFSRESILRAYGVDAELCYLGVDGALFHGADRPSRDHVIGLGAITREKNLELAIHAIAAIPEPRPPLVWVGNFADQSYLKHVIALATQLGVSLDVRVRVADDELLDLLGSARIMIYVSRLEPLGLAPLEAGACGVPVVAVAEGGVRETVVHEKNGLLADPNPDALAAALIRLLENPALSRQLGAAGRAAVEGPWSKKAAIDLLVAKLERCAGIGSRFNTPLTAFV